MLHCTSPISILSTISLDLSNSPAALFVDLAYMRTFTEFFLLLVPCFCWTSMTMMMVAAANEEQERLTTTSTSGNNNAGVFDAVHVEYTEMAHWYDSFWEGYLQKTLPKPLALVQERVVLQQQQQQRKKMAEQEDSNTTTTAVTVADIACGTGVFLRRYLDETTHPSNDTATTTVLIGVEPNGAMLEQARQKFEEPPNSRVVVELRQAPAEALPIDDASIHVVCSTNAFHFFRDKPTALQEMKRILQPGGALVITDWCNDSLLVKLYHNVIERSRWMHFGHKYPGPLKSQQLLQLVQDAGFDNVVIETYTIRFWKIIVWGMQTVTATKNAEDASCEA